jgi:hypothetical protein
MHRARYPRRTGVSPVKDRFPLPDQVEDRFRGNDRERFGADESAPYRINLKTCNLITRGDFNVLL